MPESDLVDGRTAVVTGAGEIGAELGARVFPPAIGPLEVARAAVVGILRTDPPCAVGD